jgi:Flp pilus assembly pilin Flp
MYRKLRNAALHRLGAHEGQVLIEYALILGVLTLLILTTGVLHALGVSVSGLLGQDSSNMTKVLNS